MQLSFLTFKTFNFIYQTYKIKNEKLILSLRLDFLLNFNKSRCFKFLEKISFIPPQLSIVLQLFPKLLKISI